LGSLRSLQIKDKVSEFVIYENSYCDKFFLTRMPSFRRFYGDLTSKPIRRMSVMVKVLGLEGHLKAIGLDDELGIIRFAGLSPHQRSAHLDTLGKVSYEDGGILFDCDDDFLSKDDIVEVYYCVEGIHLGKS
jgi:hypothetical protein